MKIYTAKDTATQMLEARRRRLYATIEALRIAGHERVVTWSEDTDLAQVAAERDASEALQHLLYELQQDVERALTRLETGGYGICDECSRPISSERLRVLPEATRCVTCQRHHNRDPHLDDCA
jgi:DnaK suppressor protein